MGKRDSSNKASWIQKKWVSEPYRESCPNHTWIIPQTSQFWTLVHLQDQNLCFVRKIFSLQPFPTGYTTPPAASEKNPTSCNGTNMPTPKRTHHFNCSTLKQNPAAAPPAGQLQSGHATLTAAPCSVQQHPSLAPLQHELGTVRTLLAAPSSITHAAAPAG